MLEAIAAAAVAAAVLICGVFWALLYRHFKSVWPGVISHAVWDAMIFIVIPIK